MITMERWEEITRLTLVTSRRDMAERLEKQAAEFEKGNLFVLGQNAISLRADAAVARWEADTIERDGHLPQAYLDILP